MTYIIEGTLFFAPYVLSAFLLALLFGLALHGKFGPAKAGEAPTKPTGLAARAAATGRATTFFFMFAAFGAVIAYFLSLGIKEDGGNWINPLVDGFATPLVALLTAGVSFFAKREAPQDAALVVPAGVICFLVESVICYRGMFLQAIGDR